MVIGDSFTEAAKQKRKEEKKRKEKKRKETKRKKEGKEQKKRGRNEAVIIHDDDQDEQHDQIRSDEFLSSEENIKHMHMDKDCESNKWVRWGKISQR